MGLKRYEFYFLAKAEAFGTDPVDAWHSVEKRIWFVGVSLPEPSVVTKEVDIQPEE